MADNYLEKRMADYRAGLLSKPLQRQRPRSAAPAPAVHLCGFPDLVKPLRALGALVSFSGVETSRGMALAQASGSIFCPLPVDEAISAVAGKRGRGIDAVVSAEPAAGVTMVIGPDAPEGIHLLSADLSDETLAALIVALSKIQKPVAVSPRG